MIALIDAYLNGDRTLSNDRLSYLIISSDCANTIIPTDHSLESVKKNYDLMICATHFLGDGMALHQFANDFFVLLGSYMNEMALLEKLTIEWSEKYTNALPKVIHSSSKKKIKLTHIVDSSRRYHLQWKIGYPLPQLESSTRWLLLLISIIVNERSS